MGKDIVKIADYNGYSSSRSVEDALNMAKEIAKKEGQKTVLILLLDDGGDNYDIQHVSGGLNRNVDVATLLDCAKFEIQLEMFGGGD